MDGVYVYYTARRFGVNWKNGGGASSPPSLKREGLWGSDLFFCTKKEPARLRMQSRAGSNDCQYLTNRGGEMFTVKVHFDHIAVVQVLCDDLARDERFHAALQEAL